MPRRSPAKTAFVPKAVYRTVFASVIPACAGLAACDRANGQVIVLAQIAFDSGPPVRPQRIDAAAPRDAIDALGATRPDAARFDAAHTDAARTDADSDARGRRHRSAPDAGRIIRLAIHAFGHHDGLTD